MRAGKKGPCQKQEAFPGKHIITELGMENFNLPIQQLRVTKRTTED